jgi:formylglycine-generating enzyme required for sulfatase activity
MRRNLFLLVTALAVGLLALEAQATRLALVIGNDAYQKVNPLKNARNDARLMASILQKAGFDVTQASNLGRDSLWSTIDTFKGRINKGDEVVFYFAGHGVQIGANQLLLPTDIEARNDAQVQRDGVPLLDVQDALKDARVAVLLLDACRDNPFPKTGTRAVGGSRGLTPPEPSTGQIIMMSAGRNQKALDYVPGQQQGNGLFTWELSQVLQTPGVEIRAALEQVKERVDDKARKAGHEQRPSLVNDLRGNFYLANGNAVQLASLKPEPVTPTALPGQTSGLALEDLQKEEETRQAWAKWQGQMKADFDKTAAFNGSADLQTKAWQRFLAAWAQDNPLSREDDDLRSQAMARQQRAQQQSAAQTQPALPAAPTAGQSLKDCAQCPELVVIPAGRFTMGSSAAERALAFEGTDRESPQHSVSVKSIAVGKYAVTKGEFAEFVSAKSYVTEAEKDDGCYVWKDSKWQTDKAYNWRNVGFKQEDDHPVACVSWNDAQAYVQWLSQTSGKTYRLLTEAEREYAARAGTQSAFWWGDTINTSRANYDGTGLSYNGSAEGDYRQATVAVSSFKANSFGLYNMHGNVFEWVEDCFHDNYSGAPTDGSAWTTGCSGNYRVLRGGSWSYNPAYLRSAFRFWDAPDNRNFISGFRLARTLLTP